MFSFRRIHFDKVERFLAEFDTLIKQGLENGLKGVGLVTQKKLKDHINSQDINWTPLNEKYKAWKAKKGLSEKTLIATGKYLENITFEVEKEKLQVSVGVKGQELATIAKTLEYGSVVNNLPARPLYEPTGREVVEWQERKQSLKEAVLRNIRRKYKTM